MFKVRSITTQLMAAVLASGCLALALGARAEAGPHSKEVEADGYESTGCKRAKLSAWFERQRQLTAATKAPRENRRWDMEGVLGGQ
jgi:hypothetical protein